MRSGSRNGRGKGVDAHWEVGGKYLVLWDQVPLWARQGPCEEMVGELSRKDEILLIYVSSSIGVPVSGLVLKRDGDHGWLILEDPNEPQYQPVKKSKLSDSWNMGGRYSVVSEATVRQDRSLESEWIGELAPGDEVLVLELGMNDTDAEQHRVRLRARVSTDDGLVGWISPQTAHGDQLLCFLDLLSEEVLQVVKESSSPKGRSSRMPLLGRTKSDSSFGMRSRSQSGDLQRSPSMTARKNYKSGEILPWVQGGQYRILEATRVKEEIPLRSKDICKVPAGALVNLKRLDIASPECCPVAYCSIQSSGPENGLEGWLRCTNSEGYAIIDSRDQLQYHKVVKRLQTEQLEKQKREAEEARARAREAELERQKQQEEKLRRQREEEEAKTREEEEEEEKAAASKARRISLSGVAGSVQPCFAGCAGSLLPALESLAAKVKAKVASSEPTSSSSSSSKRPSDKGSGGLIERDYV